jgi:hypothetical protein
MAEENEVAQPFERLKVPQSVGGYHTRIRHVCVGEKQERQIRKFPEICQPSIGQPRTAFDNQGTQFRNLFQALYELRVGDL